ncbi:YvrJ family protein [Lacticaseibacillus porcinae]|uniref:YvrJ family protein n=1 Tax=Lacticaseibacillus porcinae TaxID=1123687 RepID=UPI00177B27D6|nr:YvrJ family protein [Lacticaseibacillus porcinae]
MDQLINSMLDQAIGGLIAVILLTKIDKRLESMTQAMDTLTAAIKEVLTHVDTISR